MTTAEVTDWAAYEQVYGPLLLHERIDLGFAMLAYYMCNLWSKRSYKLTEFLPPWYDIKKTKHDPLEGFKRLLELAEANPANDQHPDG